MPVMLLDQVDMESWGYIYSCFSIMSFISAVFKLFAPRTPNFLGIARTNPII